MIGKTYYFKLSDGSYTQLKVVSYTKNKYIVTCLMDNKDYINVHKDLLIDYDFNWIN